MKKNNKFRNNGNSNAFSLNYKFDSVSPAGKYSGTALDLIKRYNELAKEAHGSGDYIAMEVFRQYAEHYRKIVTEINERKNMRLENNAQQQEQNQNKEDQNPELKAEAEAGMPEVETAPRPKTFKVIEIGSENEVVNVNAQEEPVKKVVRRRKITIMPDSDNKSEGKSGVEAV